jgi:hypothetical protein
MLKRFWFWLTHNASSAPDRVLANILRRRGWVVFWLDEEHRCCNAEARVCWMQLYEEERKRHGV